MKLEETLEITACCHSQGLQVVGSSRTNCSLRRIILLSEFSRLISVPGVLEWQMHNLRPVSGLILTSGGVLKTWGGTEWNTGTLLTPVAFALCSSQPQKLNAMLILHFGSSMKSIERIYRRLAPTSPFFLRGGQLWLERQRGSCLEKLATCNTEKWNKLRFFHREPGRWGADLLGQPLSMHWTESEGRAFVCCHLSHH